MTQAEDVLSSFNGWMFLVHGPVHRRWLERSPFHRHRYRVIRKAGGTDSHPHLPVYKELVRRCQHLILFGCGRVEYQTNRFESGTTLQFDELDY